MKVVKAFVSSTAADTVNVVRMTMKRKKNRSQDMQRKVQEGEKCNNKEGICFERGRRRNRIQDIRNLQADNWQGCDENTVER